MSSSAKIVGTGANWPNSGDFSWSNPENITDDDSDYAEVIGVSGSADGIEGYNCGFAIPSGATINGIVVEMSMLSAGDGEFIAVCRIRKADGSYGTQEIDPSSFSPPVGSYGTITWGSPTELWGETWSYADINDSDFGALFVVAGIEAEVEGWIRIQYMKITVYYTEAGSSVIKTVNGLAKASNGVITGVAIASVKTWNGVA